MNNILTKKIGFEFDPQTVGEWFKKRYGKHHWITALLKSSIFYYRKFRGLILRKKLVSSYFNSHQMRKVSIGTGYHKREGWLNTDYYPVSSDIVYMDATKKFPFPKESVDYIFSEHMIEHIPYEASDLMLRQIKHVLKPGGKIRMVTPDLDKFLGIKTEFFGDITKRYVEWSNRTFDDLDLEEQKLASFAINRVSRDWGHKFIFDRETLEYKLKKIGFTNVVFCDVNVSSDPNLSEMEHHGDLVGVEFNDFESLVFEAQKPFGE